MAGKSELRKMQVTVRGMVVPEGLLKIKALIRKDFRTKDDGFIECSLHLVWSYVSNFVIFTPFFPFHPINVLSLVGKIVSPSHG